MTEVYYKVRQVLQSVTEVYYKMRQVLQSVTVLLQSFYTKIYCQDKNLTMSPIKININGMLH